jgi:hypothetical protein
MILFANGIVMISKKTIKLLCLTAGLTSAVYSTMPVIVSAETAPVQPKVQEVPLPPPVELPAPPNVPADTANRPLTVEEAVAIALKYQPDITIARTIIEAAHGW